MKKAIITAALAGTFIFSGHQANAQTTANTVTLTKVTAAYDKPNGTVVTSFAPQTIPVITTNGSWEEISTSTGPLWLDTTTLNKVTLTVMTDAYDKPNGTKVASFGPQTVSVLASSGSWYQISTYMGPLWINTAPPTTVTLNAVTDAYDSPNGTKVTSFGPQTVSVIGSSAGWKEISTSMGPLWINEATLNKVTFTIETDAFDKPNGTKVISFGPQTVSVIGSSGSWEEISTSMGPLWINAATLNKVTLTVVSDAYDKPNGTKVTSVQPQTASVLASTGSWDEISTSAGPLWVNTAALTKVTLNATTDAYNQPNGTKVTSFSPQTVSVIGSSGSWDEINTGMGPLWINTATMNKVTLTVVTDAYDQPNGTKVMSFAPQTISVVGSSGSWEEINTSSGPLWINTATLNKLTLTKVTDAYNQPNGTKVTSFSPQTVTVLSTQGQWYQISTGMGPLYVNPSLVSVSVKTIVIDPGHGGWDSGAIAIDGSLERVYNYSFAVAIQSALKAGGYNVILTRPSNDSCIPGTTSTPLDLQCRVDVATKNHADLFISVHNNTISTDSSVHGTEIYYNARNDYDGHENPYPVQSQALANDLDAVVPSAVGTPDRGVFDENLYVNRMATVPSVLMELGYLSNWGDLNLLKSSTVQSRVGQAVVNAVNTYFH